MNENLCLETNEQVGILMESELEVEMWFQGELELVSKMIGFDEDIVRFVEGSYLRENVELMGR